MNKTIITIAAASVVALTVPFISVPSDAADSTPILNTPLLNTPVLNTPIQTTVTVDAGQTLRVMNPRRLGGTNVAMWNSPSTLHASEVRKWMAELRPGYVRLPGGSWANCTYWNGNGVRGADGKVDPGKVGTDGYPAVDYSSYAPSFLVDDKTLHPKSDGWHGNVDVKTLQEWIQAIPGTEPLPCPNVGTGRAVDAAEWVRWANKTMGYNARTWEIGNELEGSWEPGHFLPGGQGTITASIYTKRYNAMATAMRQVDPTIKIGGLTFPEAMLRDCGDNVDFVSIHTYPGSATAGEDALFADIGKTVPHEVGQVQGWIHKYQPQRKKKIEIGYTEWNLGGGVSTAQMFSGLWASIFLGQMAKSGVDFATNWDLFTPNQGIGGALIFEDGPKHTRSAEYYALWLWNNYMGDRLIPATSGSEAIYTYASRSDDAVSMMLINTDRERAAKVNVQLSGFTPAAQGELATVTSREYYWNPITHQPQWSTGPRFERLQTGSATHVTLAPFSMTCVRIPGQAHPALSVMAQKALVATPPAPGKPQLRFVMPDEMYVGDSVPGEVMALAAGSDQPYPGTLAPAKLTASGGAELDRSTARLAESLGHFTVKPTVPGELTIIAQSGDVQASHTITVKPSVPRPVVFYDFTDPPATNSDYFSSDFTLTEDLTQRANRAVACVVLPAGGAVPTEQKHMLLQVKRLPEGDKLKKENIRGVVFDVKTSPDFACDDPDVSITVVMQSTANWWMPLGDISLRDAAQWQTHQVEVKLAEHIKAMPAALNVSFILKANKPVKGSIYLDRIGFLVR